MESSTKDNLTDRSKWVRILYMVFFALAYGVAELLFWLVALFQAVVVLVTGRANEAALRFGQNLSVYIYQIVQFETFNSEFLPFPFNDWPDESPAEDNVWVQAEASRETTEPEVVEATTPSTESETPSAESETPSADSETSEAADTGEASETDDPEKPSA